MAANPALVRNMLRTYGRQVTTARRLARYHRSLKAAGAEDEVAISREAKRRELVHKVAAEIVESLIVTGSENPVVEDIKRELEHEFKTRLFFAYPPEEQDLQIFRVASGKDPVEVTGQDRTHILERLWHLTLAKIDETML